MWSSGCCLLNTEGHSYGTIWVKLPVLFSCSVVLHKARVLFSCCVALYTCPQINWLLIGEKGQMFMEPLWIVLGGCSCSHLPCVGSREAARECRRKKKEYVKCLENRVAVLENQNKTLIEELKALKDLYCHKAE